MSKNNQLINSLCKIAKQNREENLKNASREAVPVIYSGLALLLWNKGWTQNEILNLFAESQDMWEREGGKGIIKRCEDVTGIVLTGTEQEST